jgi:hypothetical protein
MDQTTKNREFVKRHFEAVNRQTDRPEAIDHTLCFIWLEIWSAYLMPSTRKQR